MNKRFSKPRSPVGVPVRGALAALGLALACALPSAHAAAVLDTLGGGPLQGFPNANGYIDGNTFQVAQFNEPSGLAVNSAGNTAYIADHLNNAVRRVSQLGVTASSITSTFTTNGINRPIAIAVDGANRVYVLNRGNGNNGNVLVFNPAANPLGAKLGNLTNATALALDGSTNLYVAVRGNTIIRVSANATNTVGVIAEAGTLVKGIAVMDSGLLALSDAGNHGVWLFDPANGTYTAFTGFNGAGDNFGDAGFAQFNGPEMIAKAGGGLLVIADRGNHRVKVIDPVGAVSNLYGVSSNLWYVGQGAYPGWWDGTVCEFDELGCPEAREPYGVVVGPSGNVYTTERYYHLLRQASVTGLTGPNGGGGSGTNGVVVTAPSISPDFGYFPMGRTITVNSPNPNVRYTTDGTEPTLSSRAVVMNGNIGTIRWTSATNNLTALRVRAFVGTNGSPVTSGVSAPTNSVGIPQGLSGPLLAGVGSKIIVPVVADLRTNDTVKSYIFRVEVTANNGAPIIPDQFEVLSVTSNDFLYVVTSAREGAIGSYSATPYGPIGSTRGLAVTAIGTNANMSFQHYGIVAMLAVPIPTTAQVGQTYTINVLNSSATSDGGQQAVAFPPKPSMTILVTNVPYTVGDVAVSGWYNAGEFGNQDLDNGDVNSAFYASTGLRLPYTFSDVYDAMDAWPPDDFGFVGGDGELTFLDWAVTLDRALALDEGNWLRAWATGGDRTNAPTTLIPGGVSDFGVQSIVAAPWHRPALVSARNVGNVLAGGLVSVPVYVRTDSSANVKGFQFRCMITPDNGGPSLEVSPSFTAAMGVNPPTQGTAAPNELACGWPLGSVNFGPHTSNYLGTVRFNLPATAQAGQKYTISFANSSGALDIYTPYTFETKRATLSVGTPAVTNPDATSDDWKTFFFGSVTEPNAAPNVDADNDSVPNWAEFIAGTDPTQADSRLEFSSTTSQVVGGQRRVTLTWLSAPGKTYEILAGGSPGSIADGIIHTVVGDGLFKEFTDTNPGNTRFYRLRVQP